MCSDDCVYLFVCGPGTKIRDIQPIERPTEGQVTCSCTLDLAQGCQLCLKCLPRGFPARRASYQRQQTLWHCRLSLCRLCQGPSLPEVGDYSG